MDERRHWWSELATSCGCPLHEFSNHGGMISEHAVERRISELLVRDRLNSCC